MEGFEQMRSGERSGLPIDAPEVQGALMLLEYRELHSDAAVDIEHWEGNDEAIQSAAATEWIGDPDDKHSFAALYRTYAEQHPQEHINISDDRVLKRILATLVAEKSQFDRERPH